MPRKADLGVNLARENERLAAQVRALSGDEHIRREAAPWCDATPAERIAATWRLCALVPWFRSLWPEDVRQRAEQSDPLPAHTLALLKRLKQAGRSG
jgi:hypothetical protein